MPTWVRYINGTKIGLLLPDHNVADTACLRCKEQTAV